MSELQPGEIQFEPATAAQPVPIRARSLGQRLRAARESAGMTLADVAARTRVPERMLGAIEADAYDSLPHSTFTNGFVRSFAREVGLPEAEAGAQFRAENTHVPAMPISVPLRQIEIERVPSGRLALAGIVAAVVIAVGGGLYFATRDRDVAPSQTAAQPVGTPATAGATASAASATTPAAAPAPSRAAALAQVAPAPPGPGPATAIAAGNGPVAIPAPAGPDTVVLTATQDAWVQIRDRATRQRVMSGVLAQGQSYTVPAGDFTLWTGRAGALQVRVGGKLLAPLGGPAETIRNVSLSAASLAGRPAASAVAAAPAG